MTIATLALLLAITAAPSPAPSSAPATAPAAAPAAEAAAPACTPEPAAPLEVVPPWTFWRNAPAGETTLEVRYRIDPDGSVREVEVLPGSHHPMFSREAQRSVRAWVFRPFDCAPGGVVQQRALTFRSPDYVD